MKKLIFLGLGALLLAGCNMDFGIGPQVVGSGKLGSDSRKVDAFTGVRLEGAMDADIKIGSQSEIKIEGDDNIVPLVMTEVKDGTLRIYTQGNISTKKGIKVTFTVPELNDASVNGSGNITIKDYRGKDLTIAINGSGDASVTGVTDKVDAAIRGSGGLKLYGLSAKDAEVSISGSGDAEVTATDHLAANIAGSGGISYKGHPKSVDKSVAGSGDIKPAD